VVFLNGGYYGMAFVKSPRTEDHWRRQYGGREAGFEHIGSNENGTATCGRQSCGRAIANGTGREDSSNNRTLPTLCTDAAPCGRGDCSDYWSGFNTGCTVGNCRGVGDLSANTATPGSWDEVKRLALGAASGRITTEQRQAANGLTNDANWARFRELVDVDNLMHYYALQIYGANVDWPSNNMEMWRYFPNTDEAAAVAAGTMHPHLDGKWRFIGQDFEYGYGLWQGGDPLPSATNENDNTLWALMNRPGATRPSQLNSRSHFNATTAASFLIPALMQRQDARAMLANALSDVIEGSHAWANAEPEYVRIRNMIQEEHSFNLGGTRISELARNGTDNVGPGWPTAEAIFTNPEAGFGHAALRSFLQNRGNTTRGVPSHIESELGLRWSARTEVSLTAGANGDAVLNTRPVSAGNTLRGSYWFNSGSTVTITAKPYPGYVVANVTGATAVAGQHNTYSVSSGGSVSITFAKDPNDTPRINALQARRGNWIEVTNFSDQKLSTKGLYLSDGNNNFFKYRIPGIIIKPGETILFWTSSNTYSPALSNTPGHLHKRSNVGFGINFGERLRLTRHDGEVIQLVEISMMTDRQKQERQADGNWTIVGPGPEYVPPHNPSAGNDNDPNPGWDVSVEASGDGGWRDNQNRPISRVTVTITNLEDERVDGWEIRIPVAPGTVVQDSWDGRFTIDGNFLVVTSNAAHNAYFNGGQSRTFSGALANEDFPLDIGW
jgi:hypothetical protein